MDQQPQAPLAQQPNEPVMKPVSRAANNSKIKRSSRGLIDSVTRVNVSDGILASGGNTKDSAIKHSRQLRSASASVASSVPIALLDALGGCPIAVLGSSSSTDENDPYNSVDFNSDDETIVNIRNKFNISSPIRFLVARNAALTSSNSSLNGSVSSAIKLNVI